jgi:hypothetical protein
LEVFFVALATSGLAVNLEKCVFAVPTLEILGHMILAAGSAPMAVHTPTVDTCPLPQDIKDYNIFHGIVNFYRHFLPSCVPVLLPLTNLLKGGTAAAEEAF